MNELKISIRYSCITAMSLILCFLLLSLFKLHTNPLFSLFNGVILGGALYKTIQHLKQEQKKEFKYQNGFFTGILMGFLATLFFTIFFGVYATHISPDFLNELMSVWIKEYYTSVGLVLFVVAIMGFASTIVLTLSFMQLFKVSWNTSRKKQVSIANT